MILNVEKIAKNNAEYYILPYQFLLLTFWGIWCPQSWPNKFKIFHNLCFMTVFFLDFLMCTEMMIHFIITVGTGDFKLVNFFFVSANITAIYKSLKLNQNRDIIRSFILNYFDYEWTNVQDYKEFKIHHEINSRIRNITITYAASMIAIVFLKALSPLAESNVVIPLPVDAWYPYPIENTYCFWLTYLHQVILGSSAVCAHISIDTLFVGLLLKMTGQLNILQYRLKNFKVDEKSNCNSRFYKNVINEKNIIKCVQHHERILRFGKDLNNKFQDFLIILVISSLPNICINVYSVSSYTENVNVQYIAIIFCTTSALIQFFIACWYSNEVTLNGVQIGNAIYEMNWTIFDPSTQKFLIIVMTRSSRPITFSAGYLMKLNLDSFITVIKSSYTAFNLLQNTAK